MKFPVYYHIEIWLLDDNLCPLNVVSDDIRDKLIAKGVPSEEIAFIHDAKTEKQKAELFEKVRSGDIRVLLGSANSAPYEQVNIPILRHFQMPKTISTSLFS